MLMNPLLKQAGRIVGKNKLSILIYHQVVTNQDPMRPAATDEGKFRWHMKLLRDHFNPLSMSEAVQRLQNANLPANSVCVTFDDGYLDNLEVAQPILQEFGIPATVYIATAFSNGANMWNDRLLDLIGDPGNTTIKLSTLDMGSVNVSGWDTRRALADKIVSKLKYEDYRKRDELVDAVYFENSSREASRKMMTGEEIVQLAQKGVDIGAHTVDHPILKSLSLEEQRLQLSVSKYWLEKLIDRPVTGFAYPNGTPDMDYDAASVQLVKEAGFEYAVCTTWGVSTLNTSKYELNRSTPWDASPAKFHLRMLKYMMNR